MKINSYFFILCSLVVLSWMGCEKEPEPAGTALEFVGGDNQTGYINLLLTDTLLVRIYDQNGLPFGDFDVAFKTDSAAFGSLASNGLSGDSITVSTDSLGFAYAVWTLGNVVGTQSVTITANGLSGSPRVVTAKGIPWMQDSRDGSYYRTVTIGTQRWMAENLNFETTSSFTNSSFPSEVYGRLYTWSEATTICPPGWHLPTDAEWTILENELGGNAVGTMLKSNSGWNFGNGTNFSGMNIYPAGQVNSVDTTFEFLTAEASLWTATDNTATEAWRRKLANGSVGVTKGLMDKNFGLSCRCVED